MVLIRFAPLLLIACSQSLFDNTIKDKDGGTGGEMPVSSSCTAPCVGDAGGDYDGTPAGKTGRWRYVEDHRNRTWAPMTPDAQGVMIGATTANFITVCDAGRTEHACQALPGALLVSAAGAGAPADPAIELTTPMNQHVTISLRVHVPVGAGAQQVRLYRNSREDVLFTGDAQPGVGLDTSITIDTLASDRILFALAAQTAVQYVGVQLFVSGTGMAFPQSCQVAVSFASATGTTMDNLCGGDFISQDYTMPNPVAPTLGAGPFPEQGMGADLVENRYYEGMNLVNRGGDTTLQFWLRHDALIDPYGAWPYSDLDLDDVNPGGLGVVLYNDNGLKLEVNTCTSGNPLAFTFDATPFPTDGGWHFVRIVHSGGNVEVCLDGERKFSLAVPAGKLATKYKPHFGRNVRWTPAGAFYDGGIDDVRVFSGALPCD